jgi:hypothetical protein
MAAGTFGFRNRLTGAVSWCWSYVSFQHGSRLITGIRENCGSIPVLQALRQDNLNRQGIPQF